jgi:hypothetical protein
MPTSSWEGPGMKATYSQSWLQCWYGKAVVRNASHKYYNSLLINTYHATTGPNPCWLQVTLHHSFSPFLPLLLPPIKAQCPSRVLGSVLCVLLRHQLLTLAAHKKNLEEPPKILIYSLYHGLDIEISRSFWVVLTCSLLWAKDIILKTPTLRKGRDGPLST